MTLKGLLWNAREWRSKGAELIKYSRDFNVLCVTETKSKRGDRLTIPGFASNTCNNYRQGEGGAGGVAVFIRSSYRFQFLNQSNIKGNFDVTGVRILGEEETINVIVVYRRPGGIERDGIWKEIVGCVDRSENLILVGDFNAHHTAWNCDSVDRNGENMLDELEDSDMFVVNFDTLSRIGEVGQRDSNLDLIWCSVDLADRMGYQTGEDSWGSDHYPVYFDCNLSVKLYVKKTNRITTNCTGWSRYVGILLDREEEFCQESWKNLNAEDKCCFIIDELKRTAFESSGKKWMLREGRLVRYVNTRGRQGGFGGRGRNRNPVEWWDAECVRGW